MKRLELFNAIDKGDLEHLLKMKKSGISLNDVMKEEYSYSTYHIKLSKPYPDITKFLIKWELETDKYFADCILEDAADKNDVILASICIELGADVNGAIVDNGSNYRNNIIDIVNRNCVEMCKIHIKAGVDLNVVDEYNRGVFHYVKTHEMMDLILPYMTYDQEDEWGKTAYQTHMECISNGNGHNPIDKKLRTELANRIFKRLNSSKL